MSRKWVDALRVDPIPRLLAWDDPALAYFVQGDLLEQDAGPVERLWELPISQKLVKKQGADGSWRYPGKTIDPDSGTNYFLLETYRNLRVLVEMYGFQRDHPAMLNAAEFVFNTRPRRGIYAASWGTSTCPITTGQSWKT